MSEKYRIKWEPNSQGSIARIEKLRRLGRPSIETEWPSFAAGDNLVSLVGRLDPKTGDPIAEWAEERTSVRISNRWIASLDEGAAMRYGLPPATRVGVEFYSVGIPSLSDFRIHVRFKSPGGLELLREINGAFLLSGIAVERLPSPLYELVNAAIPLAENIDGQRERMRALERFTQLLEPIGQQVSTDNFLDRLRVFYASGLSLSLKNVGNEFDFEPILFGRQIQELDDGRIIEQADSLLSDVHQKSFLRDYRLRGESMNASALGNGAFVYFDPLVAKAIGVVSKASKKGNEERKKFALNPRRAFKDAFATNAIDEEAIEHIFVETDEYSERVREIEVWRPPILPWIKRAPNNWLPETYGIKVADTFVALDETRAAELRQLVSDAIDRGAEDVEFEGQRIPATSKSLETVDKILEVASVRKDQKEGAGDPEENIIAGGDKKFLVVDENFEDVTYETKPIRLPIHESDQALPGTLKTHLKKHQVAGFGWLTSAALAGNPGAVLADDMGLGKTLQALTFIAWWKEQTSHTGRGANRPTLIVAPTALQTNWTNEIETHFRESALSRRQVVSGTFLRSSATAGRDVDTGIGSLDSARLREFDVLITTFETMRDYHLSLARIAFDIVIFDEAQKIKNPASQMTRAAKSLNANFILSMTGTPVENSLQDIWSIMDVTWPGFLGSSKEFAKTFDDTSQSDLERLNTTLFSARQSQPPVMLRRLKSNAIEGLPKKTQLLRPSTMPVEQAEAYLDVVRRVKAENGKGAILRALHNWRSISVHPRAAPQFRESDIEQIINSSARFKVAFDILEEIRRRGEKALIFLEDLDWQSWLSNAIRCRFNLKENPAIINGAVPGARRQITVDQFQNDQSGFSVLILSPKAAGVGLTITAANNVIHLSRWWNPAVEDQATDRTHRIGQSKPVTIYIPQAIHPSLPTGASFDEKLDQLIEKKRVMSGSFLAPSEARDEELSTFFNDIISSASLQRQEAPPFVMPRENASGRAEDFNRIDDAKAQRIGSEHGDDPLPLGFSQIIPSASQGVDRPIEKATELLQHGTLEEIWIEDPYFACPNVLEPASAFLQESIFKQFGIPKRIMLRSFDPDHPKIRNRFDGVGKRAVVANICERLGSPVRTLFEGPTTKNFHDRFIVFVIATPYGRKSIRWALHGGLDQWLDRSRPQSSTHQVVESMPRWLK